MYEECDAIDCWPCWSHPMQWPTFSLEAKQWIQLTELASRLSFPLRGISVDSFMLCSLWINLARGSHSFFSDAESYCAMATVVVLSASETLPFVSDCDVHQVYFMP